MFVTATSMVCPVGLNAAAACAALRAKIAMFNELHYGDNDGEPIVGASVPDVELPRKATQLVEMLAKALGDLIKPQAKSDWSKVPLLVCLAEPDRPGAPDLKESVVAQLQRALKVSFHPQHSRAFAFGHTAAFEALAVARDLLSDSTIPACGVCGVDSFLNRKTLAWLEQHFRLK